MENKNNQPAKPDVIEDANHLFETGVRDGFDGWQVWFRIDHQVFFLQPVAVSVDDVENTEEKARWIERSLIPALERLANKKHKL